MPKKSRVWNHFTPLRHNGKKVGRAKCNHCPNDFVTKDGTTNLWKHLLKHFTRIVPDDQGYERGIVQCDICQSKLEASGGISRQVKHVVTCLTQKDVAAVGASQPPQVQITAPSASGSPSMDLEPAGPDAQPPPEPSVPSSRPGGSSSDGEPDIEGARYHLARMIALRGYDPSIVNDDCFRDFVESLNPGFTVPSRVDIEELCDITFRGAYLFSGKKINGARGRISLAVGKATILEREVVYTAFHFIDHEWNLHKAIVEAENKTACIESHMDIGVQMMTSTLSWMHNDEAGNNLFMMAWGVSDDHSKLKRYINQTFSHSYALKRKLVCTTFVDKIFHSAAEHLYLQIDAEFRGDVYRYILALGNQDYEQLFIHVGVDLWAQKEVWYSWYCSLLLIRKDLSGANLEFTKLLCKIWGEIYRAVERISVTNCPTSNLCLVELFNVREFLQSEIALARSGGQTNLCYEGRTAFLANKDVATVLTELSGIFDKAIQESYLVWSIPLVLDPRCNLDSVKSILRGVFGEDSGSYISELIKHLKEMHSDYTDEEFEDEYQKAQAEFHRYLNLRLVRPTESFDILDWWKVHGSRHYPTVALMARDALAMPASSQLSSEQIAHVKSSLRGYW